MVPSGIIRRTSRVARGNAEAGAQCSQSGREKEDPDLRAPAARAELLNSTSAFPSRDQNCEENNRDRQEREDSHVRARKQLHDAIGVADIGVQREESLDRNSDDHDERRDDAGDQEPEPQGRGPPPAESRMARAHEALGEDQIHDEDKHAAGLRQDPRGDGDVGGPRARGPRYPHAERHAPQHAQREQHPREHEQPAAPLVELQDRHVCCC